MKKLLTLFAFVAIAMSAMAQTITIQGALVRVPIFCLEEVCPTCEALAIATTDKIYHIKDQDCGSYLKVTIDDVEYVFEEGDEVIATGVVTTHTDFLGEEKYLIDITSIQPAEEATHEYVDLGLPSGTLWATCNIGAATPEQAGDYFAWGETEAKENYDWNTYKYGTYDEEGDYSELTKYNLIDDKTTLEATDDVSTANWGGDWRTPTKVEQDELRTECIWTWTTLNGVNGYEVKGTNGNSIFLPAAGYRYNSSLRNVGSLGYYWSSSLDESTPNSAYCLYLSSDYYVWGRNSRYYGQSVRPVFSPQSTAIETVEHSNAENVRKVMENGQVIFIRDGVRYNVLGARL